MPTRGVIRLACCAGLLVFVAFNKGLLGHEIPNDVTVRAFLKPDSDRLHLLVRVPLEAMRDFDWPTLGPGYLDLQLSKPFLGEAAQLWVAGNVQLFEEGRQLGDPTVISSRVSLPSDRSFGSFEEAQKLLHGPDLPENTQIYWQQALLDVHLEYEILSSESAFSIRPDFARLGMRVLTALFFVPPSGSERAFEFSGNPGVVRLDPRWHQAMWHFTKLGFLHILDGIDHLLFLFCLVIPLGRFRSLVLVVTSFTIAHSLTLLAAALGMAPQGLWFPALIETLIAASIVFMALENVLGSRTEWRWIITFAFGLVHGFGFSFALQETLQFAGSHLLSSLLAFNLGVELGQLLVISILVPALHLLFRHAMPQRVGTIILSLIVGHTAWHWMVERGSLLSAYEWPQWSPSSLAEALRWLLFLVLVAGILWLLSLVQKQLQLSSTQPEGHHSGTEG